MRRSLIDQLIKKGALWFHPLSAFVLVARLVTTATVPARALAFAPA
jgi:hypothetical protein